jgi:hypothetical protein
MSKPGKPLTTDGDVLCGHDPGNEGKASVNASHKLTVKSKSVLLTSDINGKTISGCMISDKSDTSGIVDQKCHTVTAVLLGWATKLKVGGEFVILDEELRGTTDGYKNHVKGLSALHGSAVQSKLKAK